MTTPRGFMPDAIIKAIPAGSSDPAIIPVGVIQHIAVSNSDSLFGLFSNDGGIESHFYIRKDGTIEQYRSIFFEADAQFAGNSFGSPRKGFVSVEHEGGVGADLNVPMPKAQLDAFHSVILWVHGVTGFPLRVTPAWDEAGVGYHALFDQWNTNHHSCPGPARIAQFHAVTVPWLRTAGRPVHVVKRAPRRRIFHVHPGQPYYLEDTWFGALTAFLLKFFGIDYDLNKTKDGVLVVGHGPRPLARNARGGYVDPEAKTASDPVHPSDTYADLTWSEVERLRTPDGKHKVWRADELVPKTLARGMERIELEAKTPHITEADWTGLLASVPAGDRSKLRAKSFPKFLPSLHGAHLAHIPVIVLTHKGEERVPKAAQSWIDFFRGRKPIWI